MQFCHYRREENIKFYALILFFLTAELAPWIFNIFLDTCSFLFCLHSSIILGYNISKPLLAEIVVDFSHLVQDFYSVI